MDNMINSLSKPITNKSPSEYWNELKSNEYKKTSKSFCIPIYSNTTQKKNWMISFAFYKTSTGQK